MSQPETAQLDRTSFKQVLKVPALRVPARYCNDLMKRLRGFTFDLPKTKCVVHDGNRQDVRLLLLKQDTDPQALNPEVTAVLQQHQGVEVVSHEVQLEYQHFSTDAVLKKLLPEGMDIPGSFESIGHIAHLNLREEALPFRHIIGQVILDKNPSIKTVVNKLGSIENEFRVFDMEVIAGDKRFETEVAQHGVRFRLDFSQVYWNSRLEAEHTRLVSTFSRSEVVADVMAGIGPFAVPAAMRGCKVYANDLNPASAKYLNLNIQLNKVTEQVQPFNMDGRQFIKLLLATPGGPADNLQQQQQQQEQPQPPAAAEAASAAGHQQQSAAAPAQPQPAVQAPKQQQQQQQRKRKLEAVVPPAVPPGFQPPPGGVLFQHAVMNLPASAVEFLDAFRGAFDPDTWKGRLPLVHVYTFMKNETEADVLSRVEAALGGRLDAPPHIHNVRDVAPNKLMLCVTFRVPEAVAFDGREGQPAAAAAGATVSQGQQQQQQQQDEPAGEGAAGEPAVKKART